MLRIQVIAESICLMLALTTHTKKIKSFDGKRGGSHEILKSDVCHDYQFSKFILINVTHITPKEAVYLLKHFLMYQRYSACKLFNDSNK